MTEPLTEQPHPDAEWIATLPLELQGVATRHGRPVTAYIVNMGASQASIGLLMRRCRGNRELEQAISVLMNALNDLSQQYAILRGWENKYLTEVKQETETAVALVSAEPRSKGGIIIPH